MADDDRRTKRSRFDQTEPEPRSSRIDRRSRSPSARQSESVRTRSPLSREARSPTATDPGLAGHVNPAAAAAAAAAKINAQLKAKQGPNEAPVIRASGSPDAQNASGDRDSSNKDIYIAGGDYIKDIEINDLRNRYTLTKGSTQQMIKDETGTDVTTRGSYYPDKNMATAANPPLYLHLTCTKKEGLEKAIQLIEDLMSKELPNLVDERRFRRREPEQSVDRDEHGRRKWPEERIPVDLEPIHGFNLRAQVVGTGGANVKHIQAKTGARVQIKGRGSGFLESSTNQESDEPMYLHIAARNPEDVAAAKELCLDLLQNVRQDYEEHKANPRPHYGHGRGDNHYGGRGGRDDGREGRGGYGGYNNRHNNRHQSGATANSAPATASSIAADYYNRYYGGTDPYAAYGGYNNYVAYYQYYVQQQQQQQQQQGATQYTPPSPR
ncbi:hypothetical protein N7470_001179 [Penicillium chermesinum]|nr:hypothetical protein N7470_001179 [Penicillium chermesinum]